MALTSAQKTSLKSDIAANANTVTYNGSSTAINALPNDTEANALIAGWYNGQASPSFTVWKSSVTLTELGDAFNGTEFSGLSSLNVTRLQGIAMYAPQGINPSRADRRAMLDDVFSGAGGTVTRPALLVLYKKLATYAQKLFSTGTGSDASPATMASNVGNTFTLTGNDVLDARNS